MSGSRRLDPPVLFGSGADHSDFGCPFVSLIEMNVGVFSASKLPLDLMAVTAKPGSR
jgi:hypothetical protein